jgi:hypothetical protein
LLNNIAGVLAPQVATPVGDYESIGTTVTVGSGGQATVSFSSIPSTYKHLQIRCISRSAGSGGSFLNLRVNSDNTLSNYARHLLYGDGGGTAGAAASTGSTITNIGKIPDSSNTAGIFAGTVIDILDYASTNKNKTIRSLSGFDANGSGEVDFNSILWMNSGTAISSIQLTTYSGSNIAQYSSFALYGIKG